MSQGEQQRFNLIFSGQLFPDTDRAKAELTLAAFFGVADPAGVAPFFSGRPIPLRRNLPRAEALRIYRQLRSVGFICDVVEIEAAATPVAAKTEQAQSNSREPTQTMGGKAPNLFALRPGFAPSDQITYESAQLRAMIYMTLCVGCIALAALIGFRLPATPAGDEPRGPLAIAAFENRQLLLMTATSLLLHERSGLPKERFSAEELGLASLSPPLHIVGSDEVLLNADSVDGSRRLHRCVLSTKLCEPFSSISSSSHTTAIAQTTLGDAYFVLAEEGELFRVKRSGEVAAQSKLLKPWGTPRVLARDGLLFAPASDAPLLGVYRPDANAFGQQLDALLLMPTPEENALDRISDIAISTSSRWALMGAKDLPLKLFRFDDSWGSATLVAFSEPFSQAYLSVWRDSVLVASSESPTVQRISDSGQVEAEFISSMLIDERNNWLTTRRQISLMRNFGLILPLGAALVCILVGLVHALSAKPPAVGAKSTRLLDPMPAGIDWSTPNSELKSKLRRANVAMSAPLFFCLLSFSLGNHWLAVACLLPAGIGTLAMAGKLRSGAGGQFGIVDNDIVVVDYDGRYFYGPLRTIRRQNQFLLSSQTALPIAVPGVANLSRASMERLNSLEVHAHRGGLGETLGQLWKLRHPWIIGCTVYIGAWIVSVTLLLVYFS